MSSRSQYVIKQINNVCQADRFTEGMIAVFRGYELRQSNNVAYIHINEIDQNSFDEIYNLLTHKVSS